MNERWKMFPVVTPMYNTCNNSSNKYELLKKLKDVGGYMKKLFNMIYSSEQISERYMQFKKGKTMRRYEYLTKNSFLNNANSCNYTNEKYYNEDKGNSHPRFRSQQHSTQLCFCSESN